jgi:RNA recognition motif-containing protein
MKESDSGRCKGFGFVSFASDDDAAFAMNANEAE